MITGKIISVRAHADAHTRPTANADARSKKQKKKKKTPKNSELSTDCDSIRPSASALAALVTPEKSISSELLAGLSARCSAVPLAEERTADVSARCWPRLAGDTGGARGLHARTSLRLKLPARRVAFYRCASSLPERVIDTLAFFFPLKKKKEFFTESRRCQLLLRCPPRKLELQFNAERKQIVSGSKYWPLSRLLS